MNLPDDLHRLRCSRCGNGAGSAAGAVGAETGFGGSMATRGGVCIHAAGSPLQHSRPPMRSMRA